MAVAVAIRNPAIAAIDSSPTKFAGAKKCDGGFFAVLRNHSEFCAALLKIENAVSRISLRKEGLLWFQLDDPSA